MARKKVSIIGAGPAGLFAAYTLVTQSSNIDVTIIDGGGTIEERLKTKDTLRGMGGGGLMSDGKLIFDTRVGNNLEEVISREKNQDLTNEVDKIFGRFGAPIIKQTPEEVKNLERISMQNGVEFICPQQSHIGTDKLAPLMKNFQNYLEERGVEFSFNKKIGKFNVISLPHVDFYILAPGRVGGETGWMEDSMKRLTIPYSYRPVDIGLRIEVPSIITENITNITRDMKFYLQTETYQDKVRTFCTCPNGFVGQEKHNEFKTVNGHSESGKSTENTNFALFATINLTKPLTNSNHYGRDVGFLFSRLSGDKTLAQRWGDLKVNRRSKRQKQKEYRFQSTLEDLTWGDLSLAMPQRYLTDMIEGIEKLDKIIPGLDSNSTILHAPEIKFHGLAIKTNEYLKAEQKEPRKYKRTNPEIYVAGDGSGFSRGIVGAAASGILAAQGILNS